LLCFKVDFDWNNKSLSWSIPIDIAKLSVHAMYSILWVLSQIFIGEGVSSCVTLYRPVWWVFENLIFKRRHLWMTPNYVSFSFHHQNVIECSSYGSQIKMYPNILIQLNVNAIYLYSTLFNIYRHHNKLSKKTVIDFLFSLQSVSRVQSIWAIFVYYQQVLMKYSKK